MANLTTREFWASTAERAVRTAAQTAIALIGTDQVGLLNLDWAQIGSVVATATVLSILTSIVGDTATKNGPAFVHAEGIGVANDTSSAVSFAFDASEGDDEDDLIEDEEEPAEVDYNDAPDEDPEALAAAEADYTPPAEGYRPRH